MEARLRVSGLRSGFFRLGCLSQLNSCTNNNTLLRLLQGRQHEMAREWHVFLLSSQKAEGPDSSGVAHHWYQVMIMQLQCNRPLHEHHTPTRFCSSQFCPWKQLYLDTRKWAGLWDMWISPPPPPPPPPPLDSHNHWQPVCNLLEETAVIGFHVRWKWPNLQVWKTSSSLRKVHPLKVHCILCLEFCVNLCVL